MSLKEIYSREITSCCPADRAGTWSGVDGKGFHVGVVLTDSAGEKWLVHNTISSANKPVLTSAANMSGQWNYGTVSPVSGKTIGQMMAIVEPLGKWSVFNNCVDCMSKVLKFLGWKPSQSALNAALFKGISEAMMSL